MFATIARRLPWRALLVSLGLVPVLYAESWALGPPFLLSVLAKVVWIVDYKRTPDGTELLYTNSMDLMAFSRRRPGSGWVLCWMGHHEGPFDGQIQVLPNDTKVFVRREREGDFFHDLPRNTGRYFDWALDDRNFCDPGEPFVDANPVVGERGSRRRAE